MRKIYTLLFLLTVVFSSCKSTYKVPAFEETEAPAIPDYTDENSWAVLPNKYPENFKKYASQEIDTLQADVFYVYPTLINDKKDPRWNVSITDEKQNKEVINTTVLMQASAFAISGKVYVPFYRQAHSKSYGLFDKGGKEAQDLAYSDVKKAFEVYLKKYNQGRPIIIASHSQGTTHTSRLLKELFDGRPLQKKLIAAYIVGIRLKPDLYSTIRPMTSPTETGGFLAWNTFKKNKYPKEDKDFYKGSVTSNPITWNEAKTTTLDDHKGFLFTNEKIYKKALKIEITDGLVWSTNPKFPLRLFMSFLKNYHDGDINLFWQDIRENSVLRTNTWLKNQK